MCVELGRYAINGLCLALLFSAKRGVCGVLGRWGNVVIGEMVAIAMMGLVRGLFVCLFGSGGFCGGGRKGVCLIDRGRGGRLGLCR